MDSEIDMCLEYLRVTVPCPVGDEKQFLIGFVSLEDRDFQRPFLLRP